MNRRNEFLDILLRGAGPSLALLLAFAMGLLMVSILGNLAYDLLVSPPERPLAILRPLAAAALLTLAAYGLYRHDRSRKQTVRAEVDETRLAPPYAGLVWLLGPGPFDHLLFALEHHRQKGGGVHCWLVMQDTDRVQQAFSQLSQELLQRGWPTRLHPMYIEELEVRAAYQAVRAIFDREAGEEGLAPHQVIADITGGTKPLTAGMVLAALTAGGSLEYVESERDSLGQPIPGTLRVVLVDTTFYLAQEA